MLCWFPLYTTWISYAMLCFVTQSCPTLCDPMNCSPPGSSAHGDSPGKNTGVDCHTLFQGIFPTLDWTHVSCFAGVLYHLSHHRSQRVPEWVAYPFSRGSSRPRTWTGVACIAGRFFASWATRKPIYMYTKAFILHLINAWGRTSRKQKREREREKRWRNWRTETKWTGSTEYEIEKLKQTR